MKKTMRKLLFLLAMVCAFAGLSKEEVNAASAQMQSLVVVQNKYGLHPSYGNYTLIKASVLSGGVNASLRIRVVNSKGQYLFQKTYTGIRSNKYVNIKWNGKATAGNNAGLREGQCPGTGTYRVEALAYYSTGNGKVYSKKTAPLPINYTSATGTAGRKNLNYVQILTGDKTIDYLTEVMCNEAGVTSSMSQEEKVKRIYHWITYNFKHVHYSRSNSSYTKYYNVSSLEAKISSYRTSVNNKIKAGTAIFNFYNPYQITWNIERRIGQCNDHAAVFKLMCNHMGIEAEICHGYYLNRNGTRMGHYWNSAVVDGMIFYYDVDVELQNLGKGQGDYYWYKKNRTEAEKTHLFTE